MLPQGTFDKYEIVSTLQESAATAVFLVKHASLGDVRILKSIHQDEPDAKRILREAHLLSGINSPEIPTIYDVGKFNNYYYLVEEYIAGRPLSELIVDKSLLTRQQVISIAIAVCAIIEKLHYAYDEVILYRDMKPEHIVLTENGVRLIDFGAAVQISEARDVPYYGTKSFVDVNYCDIAQSDVSCDIYGIGKVIEQMMQCLPNKERYGLNNIVVRATNARAEDRIESVRVLKKELCKLQEKDKTRKKENKKHLAKTIAVVSDQSAVGATHIAIGLTTFLNENKIRAYYVDKKGDGVLQRLYMTNPEFKKEKGVLYHNQFYGFMKYGEAVEQITPPDELLVLDYGSSKYLDDADLVLYVTSGSFWKQGTNYPDYVKRDNCTVICNFSSKLDSFITAKRTGKRVYTYPLALRRLRTSKDERRLFTTMIKREGWFG